MSQKPVMQYPAPKKSIRERLKAKFAKTEPLVVSYARYKPPGHLMEIHQALKQVRENPYYEHMHHNIADMVEAYGDPWLAGLIRKNAAGGVNNWYPEFENSWDGTFPYTARLGPRGAFNLYLGHEGNAGQSQHWILHAVGNNRGTRDTGYTFEFPNSLAHEIAYNVPNARRHITAEPDDEVTQAEDVNRFVDQMDTEERARQ